IGFFLFRPMSLPPAGPHPAPSVAASYFADGIVIHGIFDPVTAPDLPGTIVALEMISPTEGHLATSANDQGTHKELHTTDAGQTWRDDGPYAVAQPWNDRAAWRPANAGTIEASYKNGSFVVHAGTDEIPLIAATGNGVTGTMRLGTPSTVIVMTLQGN